MIRYFLGIIISSYSLMFWIIHLNMLVLNKKSIKDYFKYAFTHYETLLILFGIYFIYTSLHQKS